ncbi:hypothetical protein DL93DRAFT_1589795 [Clavulina sp. PMI_390]|nr:hypothetical protein DL93DRAFT_1589795 [Clavulina sp. PMI_390]
MVGGELEVDDAGVTKVVVELATEGDPDVSSGVVDVVRYGESVPVVFAGEEAGGDDAAEPAISTLRASMGEVGTSTISARSRVESGSATLLLVLAVTIFTSGSRIISDGTPWSSSSLSSCSESSWEDSGEGFPAKLAFSASASERGGTGS